MIKITFDPGNGVQYHYTMQGAAEQQIREFAEGRWTEILMVESEPEIRRHMPASFAIKRTQDDAD